MDEHANLRARSRAALALRLRESVAPDALHNDGEHTLRLADALVPSLSARDVAWAHEQLAARARGELRPSRAGTVQAHAAWSSTALVCSAFAPWRRDPAGLGIAGLGPFTALRLEERLLIPHGGGTPNLDVALDTERDLVGIEAKLTEHLAPSKPRPWRPAYERPAMREALDRPWGAVFEDLLAGRWSPRHLDAGQLVKHALSLRGAGVLIYIYWEPEDPTAHPEIGTHRAEIAELLARVDGARPALRALPWAEVLDGWQRTAPEHVTALRRRYAVVVPVVGAETRLSAGGSAVRDPLNPATPE